MIASGADEAINKVTFITPDGQQHTVSADAGETLMETAVRNGITGILATCGGSCACATCHVVLCDDWIDRAGRASDMEIETLYFAGERHAASRMSDDRNSHLNGLVAKVIPPR